MYLLYWRGPVAIHIVSSKDNDQDPTLKTL